MGFQLAVCSEMVFTDLPLLERIRRIDELGFAVEIWDWTAKDIDALVATGATFSSMTGYIRGNLTDPEGVDELIATTEQSIPVAARLGIPRLNLHGTGLGEGGIPVNPVEIVTGEMWLAAEKTLTRIARLGEREGAQIGEGNLIELVRRCGPAIGEIQVADVPGRCEPGTGEINYPAIARALAEMGYDGTIGLEAYASSDSELALERFRDAFSV